MSRLKSVRVSILWYIGFLVLVLEFYANAFGVVNPRWFHDHQRDMQGHVLGRLVVDRQWGFFAYGGLTGLAIPEVSSPWSALDRCEFQYEAFDKNLQATGFNPYKTQSGGQAFMLGCLDRLLPFSPATRLEVLWLFTSALTALALMGMVWWFYRQHGIGASIAVWLSIMMSGWVVVFGRNLWWSLWSFFIPFLAVGYYLFRARSPRHDRLAVPLGAVACGAVMVKCFLTGYEYITTTLIMMTCPVLHEALVGCWSWRRLRGSGMAVVAGAVVALVLASLVLCVQIAAVDGSMLDGVRHLVFSLEKRSSGLSSFNQIERVTFGQMQATGVSFEIGSILRTYLDGVAIDLNQFIKVPFWTVQRMLYVRYWTLIGVFIAGSVIVVKGGFSGRRQSLALVVTTWYSLLAPLSWFVIFKQHSYVHTHMNYILWHMPFILFGFAVVGLAVEHVKEDIAAYSVNGHHPET